MMHGGPLEKEWVFFDGKHNRVKTNSRPLKTISISMYHPMMKKIVWLVRMDCEREDEQTVTLFLNLIDEMLGTKFLPDLEKE